MLIRAVSMTVGVGVAELCTTSYTVLGNPGRTTLVQSMTCVGTLKAVGAEEQRRLDN